ncbi:glycoside hydrolase domain-containing protein [Lactiplantibacillus plantarum]|uniref:glycoside hydrolase domain-containing protein n=1 Tax=Lactiplantibacillus plantarum TaxID=1590 RepID=UPI001C27582D|nr:glycoside hydrolase domain-containing protein [Lactiplantibacillus plantarum]MBU8891036.1 DUF1906 domain-containing protein [Lactiplantibacillus plantarum]MBW2757928.1 DUF1906 domain-containing protein [Lactiplantibacillus plantarum]
MADEAVLKVQKWLNSTYGNVEGFKKAPENGQTGWATIYSLREGLQYELKVSPLGEGFGNATRKAVDGFVENLKLNYKGNVAKLIQGAFWCKGISPNDFSTVYLADTIAAVKKLQSDAGITANGTMTTNLMAALFDMSAFVLVQNGDAKIRAMQQWLNANYESYIGIRPCDGIYQRDTNEALIYALQAIEGMSPSEANGYYGNQTIALTPTVKVGEHGNIVKLIQYGLYVNNYYQSGAFDGYFSTTVANEIVAFRKFMILPDGSLSSASTYSGVADLRVIKGLLTSNGDTGRDSNTFDCATQLTDTSMIQRLYQAGFSIVGRYLTGSVGTGSAKKAKNLTSDEISKLTVAGFSIFPIYEDGGYEVSYFTESQGTKDAYLAAYAARALGFPDGTVIYFAADLDLQDGDIEGTVIAYLQAVRASLTDLGYKTGLYGTRNVCLHAAESMGISNFFVANMSYGWSGNLGFPMPKNWCFDQFVEYTTGSGVDIDQDASSGRDSGTKKFKSTGGVTADEALKYILGNTNLQIGGKYVQTIGPFKVTWLATNEVADKSSSNIVTISNNELPEADLTAILETKYKLPDWIGHLTVDGIGKWGISEKIKKGNFELEIGDSKDGEFSFKLKYYVYQVEKGPLSETLTIEIDVTFNKSDFDNWPTYDPAESFGITLAATLSVAVIISMAPAIAGSASAAGVVAAFVALATKFLTNNKG